MTVRGERAARAMRAAPVFAAQFSLAVIVLLPLAWIFLSSFKPIGDILSYPPGFLPKAWTFENFREALRIMPLATYLRNTLAYTLVTTGASLALNSLAGYAFARMRFRGKEVLFAILLASTMIPFQVTMIPLFIEVHAMGLLDSFAGLVLPRLASAAGIFFMRAYCGALPSQLEEAARLDGLGEFGIFSRIMLPLCGPALATQAALGANAAWNDLFWPLLMTSTPEKRMLANGIALFLGQENGDFGPLFAAGVVSVLPILLVFAAGQRSFARSVAASGIKE